MEFSPFNNIVKICLRGMELEEKGECEAALRMFRQGWDQATNDFEKFLTAYYIARRQKTVADKLQWLETALQFAVKVDDNAAKSAFPGLYRQVAECYENLDDHNKAKGNFARAISFQNNPSDSGPFYHGTRADLQVGSLLTAGGNSNYKSEIKMNHIYFTALVNGAGLAAALAKGNGDERVYIVEPAGPFENDPNLTDKKFPGNPTRSYRSESPLKIVGEVQSWTRPSDEELEKFREKVAGNKGEIIN